MQTSHTSSKCFINILILISDSVLHVLTYGLVVSSPTGNVCASVWCFLCPNTTSFQKVFDYGKCTHLIMRYFVIIQSSKLTHHWSTAGETLVIWVVPSWTGWIDCISHNHTSFLEENWVQRLRIYPHHSPYLRDQSL